MGLFRGYKPIGHDDTASEYWSQAGMIITDRPYAQMAINIHPNDLKRRVPPGGPLSQSWQGIQKSNPIAGVGHHFMELSYNPLQSERLMYGVINRNNPTPSFFGSGPAPSAAQQQMALDQYANPKAPSVVRSILSRLMGR